MSWLAVLGRFAEEFEIRLVDLSEVQQIVIMNSLYGGGEHIEVDLLLRGGEKVHVRDLPTSADIEKIVRDLNLEVRRSKAGKSDLSILAVEETGVRRFSFSELEQLRNFPEETGVRA
ncbi:hypothetical protein TK1367 [Thermococcus kodakarensis KOD1]|uniref:Uncharacterized protein n=1 Tax=Thermococcus kodakarensis (strain ATCC BAA-918 / JCM 12380 / KOD1) TaxID=69014 RepID=Q5JGY8_THEKO|nr:hypothetical protein [Thermococcus kodakarensis]WCN27346.1 hypothetical protein POG15_06945 [Thermococcus kodakarensis]WCN29635.1 hypothetical protein POG21_06940 [Thermococcus kodakarensis]BAD85556.1 hypothetical protein TK1367 [Thermococcus kodakarensis KOD1]